MDGILRTALPADVALLVELMGEFYAESAYPLDSERAAAALGRLVATARRSATSRCASASASKYYGRDAFLDDFFISPAFRARGLGGAVLSQVVNECRALGVLALHLEVERSNAAAQRLYRRHGFRDNERQLLTVRLA